MNSDFPLMAGLREVFDEKLFTINTKREDAIVSVFMEWFNTSGQVKRLPDLPQKLQDMQSRLRKMAKNMVIEFDDGKLVIKSDAESESLLSLLRRGSSWFNPHPDVNAAILMALASSSQPS